MHRATPHTTSQRGYTAGGARSVLGKIDDTTLMQSMSGNFQKNESRTGVEAPQNYGFTSHNFQAEKDALGKIIAGAETAMCFVGGSRSHPICGAIDDRRHRLRGLDEGDSAMHRGKDDAMQIHLSADGLFHSAPQQVRMQLVPQGSGKANPPQSKAKASQAKQSLYAEQGPAIEQRLWAGLEPELQERLQVVLDRLEGPRVAALANGGGSGGSGGGQQSGQQQNKPTGQKSVTSAGANSTEFFHVKTDESRMSHAKKCRMSEGKDDGTVLHETSSSKDYCGGTPAKHSFAKVLTTKGPAKNVFGRVG